MYENYIYLTILNETLLCYKILYTYNQFTKLLKAR